MKLITYVKNGANSFYIKRMRREWSDYSLFTMLGNNFVVADLRDIKFGERK